MTEWHCRGAGTRLGRYFVGRDVAPVARSFGDVDCDAAASGSRDVDEGQNGRDTTLSRSVEGSRGRVERWFILGMSEFGSPPNAKRVSVLAAEELVEIVACLRWRREQTVAGLVSDLQFMSDLELRGGEEDLAVLEFVCGATDSLNDLD